MLIQIALGTALMLFSILIAGMSYWLMETFLMRWRTWLISAPHRPKLILVLCIAAVWIMAQMTAGVWAWALTMMALGVFDTLELSVYFALVAFTTLGFGDVLLPVEWRLLGGMAAANGLLNIGLVTALLVEALRQVRLQQLAIGKAEILNVPVLSNRAARHLFLERHGLAGRPSGTGKGADLKTVIDALGFVQLDSVNTFARAHDLILWSRRQQYRPAVLPHLLHRDRQVFEHWTHDAAVIPMESFSHWRLRFARDEARLASRWRNDRPDGFHAKIDAVLRRVADHGGCTSGDVGGDESRGSGGWWEWHPSKTALEYLWRSGQLSVVRRDGFTKVYDLTERVIPAEHLNRRHHPQETIEWCCAGALDRLGFATSGELAAFWDHITPAEAKAWCATALAERRLIEVDVEGVDGKRRRSFAWPDVMDHVVQPPVPRLRILSPFDPALRDRKRAARLFGFHYRIEIFVPAPQRTYGYYVFPVMEGDRMVGRIDMKRAEAVLAVRAFWPEPGVKMGAGRLRALQQELERAAVFAGCRAVEFADGWIR